MFLCVCLRCTHVTGECFHSKDASSTSNVSVHEGETTPVGFEPTQGDPIGLAGRRLSHSAKVSLSSWPKLSSNVFTTEYRCIAFVYGRFSPSLPLVGRGVALLVWPNG
jgi:hypothetical protein